MDIHPVTLRTGIPTRVKPTPEAGAGAVGLLQATQYGVHGVFDAGKPLQYVELAPADLDRHRITDRDLLFQARGNQFKACLPPPDAAHVAYVASTLFIVLRVSEAVPIQYVYYLYGALGSPSAQAQLERRSRGTSVQMINLKDLRTLEIPTPNDEQLETYAKLVEQFHRNAAARERATQLERTLLDALLPTAKHEEK